MMPASEVSYKLDDIMKITVPLVLASFSSMLMMSIDRFVVGSYSIHAMNAVSMVGSYLAIPTLFFGAIASIVTVFIGQYHGAEEYKKIGGAIWQMIYFSIAISIICIPCGIYSEYFCFLPDAYRDDGLTYQAILTAFLCFPTMFNALSGFFIGRGKTGVVTTVVFISNVINLLLDIVLVCGIEGVIRPYGSVGAAIATVISLFIGNVILFAEFLSRNNREKYCTLNFAFNTAILKGCMKIGLPASFERVFSLLAWAVIFILLGNVSEDLATLESVTVSVYLVLCCYTEGLNKGAAAIVSNLIGDHRLSEIGYIFRTYMKINFCFCALISIPLVFKQGWLFAVLYKMNINVMHLETEFRIVFFLLFFCIMFDGVFWVILGILAAGGDTIWPAIVNTVLVWIIVTGPAYVMYATRTLNSVIEINALSAIASLVTAVLFYFRYKKMRWIRCVI